MDIEKDTEDLGEIKEDLDAIQADLRQAEAEKDWEQVLSLAAKAVTCGLRNEESFFAAAQAYFHMGDYDRATTWADNTLHMNPKHVGARILLARICIFNDRTEDSLAIFDFIFHYLKNITDEEAQDARKTLSYYGRVEPERIKNDYPHIAKFLGLIDEVPEDETEAIEAEETSIAGTDEEPAGEKSEAEVIADLKQNILQKEISMKEKIRLLNAFAGGFFTQDKFAAARELLEAALTLDSTHKGTLRNLAVLLAKSGDSEKAMQVASLLPKTNFLLLAALKNMQTSGHKA